MIEPQLNRKQSKGGRNDQLVFYYFLSLVVT